MTSATFTRPSRTVSRRQVRIAAAAAGLAGALVLTACSGGDSTDGSSSSPSSSAAPTATADTGGGTGGATSASDDLQGSWLATTGGKAVALVITDKKAGLFSTGGTVCSGTAGKEAGMEMIRLTCTDGSKDRATGMVDSVSKGSLQITWSGSVGKETYTKSKGGGLPTGLPTANLGQ
ncbi:MULTISPECIES: hypothetical protein [unclassified Streptomyces]|uniref:hypothetical protein n=1 Tax=unclassified Streptomyces TaxID=2593676 RepID=UPI002259E033|nr:MULTISPECIES: hypothetical protein [unclassified Streptomyces]MCX4882603.1 hypothetical protein [Streptomyces sp. NBC_00847]MCX5422635.1 hypothetical protein [Streptomyces sp. NBC_00078]